MTREKRRRKAREYYAAHREQRCLYLNNYIKNRCANDPVFLYSIRASQRKYRNKNKKRVRSRVRVWHKNNSEYHRNYIKAKLKENPNYYQDQYRRWKANNPEKYKAMLERKKQRNKKTRRKYHLRKIITDRIYLTKPEVVTRKQKAHHKRAWIVQRLIAMARDDGILDQLIKSKWRHDIVEIRSRLTRMARDDGMYQLLSTEYDNGK